MSPGRKPSRSPASTAGRVRMIRCTLRSVSAAAAIATARKVLPVPAGPIPKVIVWRRIESTYRFWFRVFGATLVLRWRQTTSSRISAGLSSASSAPVTTSCPCSINSTISSTTTAAAATSPGSPSRVSTLPRRCTSASSLPRRARSTVSSEPASSAATVLSRVSCRRATDLSTQLLPHRGADPLAVGATADLRHQRRHHLPHLLLLGRSGLRDRRGDQVRQLLVGELLRQVALDQLRLEALRGGLVDAAGALVGLGCFDPLLALALQDRDLVAVAQLRVLLEHVDDHPQRPRALAVARFHRRLDVVLDLFENGHCSK